MRKVMDDKKKMMSYVLSTDADLNREKKITQKEIAALFGVSQSTIAQAIKESRMRLEIGELQRRLTELKGEILEMEGIDVLGLPNDVRNEYKRKL